MVEIKIGETVYKVPNSWNGVTFKLYCEIVKNKDKPFTERLSIYSTIPLELVNQMTCKQIATVSELVEFMDESEVVNAFALGYESEINIGDESYFKVEKSKQYLKDNPLPVTAGAEIVELYTGDKDGNNGLKINDKPVTEVIGMVICFLQKLNTFFERFKRLNDYTPTEDEKEAGIERLANLSSFATPLSIARRTNQTPEEILQRPAEEIYMVMLVDFEESEYAKRLQRVHEENQALQKAMSKR